MTSVRVLVDGLTVGNHIYRAGELMQPEHVTRDVLRYASGELQFYDGRRIVVELAEESPVVPEPTPVETLGLMADHGVAEDARETLGELAEAILALVREGKAKRAIVRQLGATEEWTGKAAEAEFNALVESGYIVPGSRSGEYSVRD